MHAQRSSFRTRVAVMFASVGVVVAACAAYAIRVCAEHGGAARHRPQSCRWLVRRWQTLSPILGNGPEQTVIPRIYDSLLKVNAKSGVAEPRLAEPTCSRPTWRACA
jgi:hypothetical protein